MLRAQRQLSVTPRHVLVVEDDQQLALILGAAIEAKGFTASTHGEPNSVLAEVDARHPDLIVLDVFLGEASGLDLLRLLREKNPRIPVLVISGMGTVSIAVEAIKLGAADFLEKPFAIETFVGAIERLAQPIQPLQADLAPETRRLAGLTGRENEVLWQIASGASSKEAGRALGISPRTVDVHRARIKEKLNVRRAVDLVRLVYSDSNNR